MPVLAVHDEIVVESLQDQAEEAEAWVKKAMVDGMGEIVNGPKVGGPLVPIDVDVEILKSWGGD